MLVRALGFLMALCAEAAAETRYFAHADEQYLFERQSKGGAALLPDDVAPNTLLPLIVFLHGTNSVGELHLWFGGAGRDLQPLATRLMKEQKTSPFVLAGPSQTKGAAMPRTLWDRFDLNAFVEDVAHATEDVVQIDRRRVVVVGHSGAGCNASGGLATDFWTAQKQAPWTLVSIDPCLDDEMGAAFAKRPASVPLLVWWQSAMWARSPEAFWSSLVASKPEERIDRLTKLAANGPNPHDAIVPLAFEHMVHELLSTDATTNE